MAGECESAVMEKKQVWNSNCVQACFMCAQVEGKVAELGEQKKVLIKEVRIKIRQCTSSVHH
jgi:hypothetical protein